MLEYDRIDVPEGINFNKIKESHRCLICNEFYNLRVNL